MHVVCECACFPTCLNTGGQTIFGKKLTWLPSPISSNPDRADRGMYSASCWRTEREDRVAPSGVATEEKIHEH